MLTIVTIKFVRVNKARDEKVARQKICKKSHFCTRGHFCSSFNFARRHFNTYGHFCTSVNYAQYKIKKKELSFMLVLMFLLLL